MLAFLEREHFRYRRQANVAKTESEIDLAERWSLELQAQASPLVARLEQDFRRFMRECMDVEFAAPDSSPRHLLFHLRGEGAAEDESFNLEVKPDEIEASAASERGLLQAAHYIERLCSRRGGPFIGVGTTDHRPRFTPRIAQSAFCATPCRLDNPILLTDDYLSLLSHFGVNGVHVGLGIWDFGPSSLLPELTSPDWEANAGHLRSLCDRAAVFGIDIYPVVHTGIVAADSPIFRRNPDVRGALLQYSMPGERYCLCSSHPVVLKSYEELLEGLFRNAPRLRGAIFIVGGEGFVHCFTRPKPPLIGGTCCPRCAGRNPSEDVATLMNRLASAVHQARPDALVCAWPYSAFTWSADDFAQEEFIRHLSSDVDVLSNFDTPAVVELGGARSMLIDYNIVSLGPSEQFEAQSRVLADAGKRHYAKFESTIEPGWFFLPYLPVHYRWIERIRRLKAGGVGGYVSKWQFYGVTGSLPEELLCEADWGDVEESLLAQIALRDFGTCPPTLLEGWKILSDVWERIPASHMLFGERQFYMKGPAYLGPAHPLIFDAQNRYDLVWKFFQVRGDAAELMASEEVGQIDKDAPPRYGSDLLFVYPFGIEAAENGFREAAEQWDSGVRLIRESLGEQPTDRGTMELDVCEILGIHLRTILNVIRFYRLRDALFCSQGSEETLRDRIDELRAVVTEEIDNARRALPILERDTRIGWGHAYGQVYDAEMVRDKIRQCLHVRDAELPDLQSGILFHVYGKHDAR